MKKKSQNLFHLIKSLTKSEKRYFHLFSKRHVLGEQNNYQTLFEYIKLQETYDEEEIKAHFEDKSFVKYFSVAKRQLYTYLLDSLHEFHSAKSREIEVQKSVHQAEILLRKGLLDQSKKLIRGAKKKAKDIERYNLLLEAIQIERRVLARLGFSGMKLQDIEEIQQEERFCLNILKEESDYQHLLWQVYHGHARRGAARSTEEQAKLQKLSQHSALKDATLPRTFISKLNFHQIWATLHFMQGQIPRAKEHNQAIIELFHANNIKIVEMPERYFSSLKNYLVDCLVQGLHDEIDESIQYIRTEIERPTYKSMPRLKIEIFCLTYTLQLNSCINQGEFERGKFLLVEVEKGLKQYQAQISKQNKITFYHLLAYIYFGLDDFSSALKWVNHILNDGEQNILQHVYAFARLFNLMIHFELENFDILLSLLRNSSRYLRKVDQLYEVEKLFIKYFRKVVEVPLNEQNNVWKTLLEQLLILQEKGEDRQLLFNLIPWIKAKIEGKTFGEMVGS